MSVEGHRINMKTALAVAFCLSVGLLGSAQSKPDQKDWIQLFNGRDLTDWTIKFAHHDLGENVNNTFRVEDGLLKVRYDKWPTFNGEFGHIFYKRAVLVLPACRRIPLRRRAGEDRADRSGLGDPQQRPDAALARSEDDAEGSGLSDLDRSPAARRARRRQAADDGEPLHAGDERRHGRQAASRAHCTNSTSKTYDGDQWVRVEVLVHGDELVRHMVEGQTVLEYSKPQIGGGSASPTDPAVKVDGTPLTGGYISLQAETAPIDFRKVELLNLEGCMDPKASNYKSYFVKSNPAMCK